jgi:hypothetical protein
MESSLEVTVGWGGPEEATMGLSGLEVAAWLERAAG